VCTGCSSNKVTLPNIPDQRVRICDLCMEGQKKNPASGEGDSSPSSPTTSQSPQPATKKKSISGPKDGRPLGSPNPSGTPVPAERPSAKKIPVDSDDSSSDGEEEEVTEVE